MLFKYFGPNIQKKFSGKILEFLKNRDKPDGAATESSSNRERWDILHRLLKM